MTVYAPVPAYARRNRNPRALLLIVAAHVALLAAVMTAKMDLPAPWDATKTEVTLVPLPPDPPRNPPEPSRQPQESRIERVPEVVPIRPVPPLQVVPLPQPLPSPGPSIGPGNGSESTTNSLPVRTGPRFITPESRVKPPYPVQKLRLEEEAALRLRLSIDESGRVTAVEPVGRADTVFLAAARRHLIAHWRYQPAVEDGRPVASSTVVTLRFQLDD